MRKRLFFIILAAVMTVAAVGCSARKSVAPAEERDLAKPLTSYGAGEGTAGSPPREPEANKNIYDDSYAADGTEPAALSGMMPSGGFDPDISQKLIHSGDVRIETTEYDDAISAMKQLLTELGGFVESSSESGTPNYSQDNLSPKIISRSAYYQIRIPKDKFQAFFDRSPELGNVVSKSSQTENITTQYYDNEARLQSLRVQQDRLLEIMGKAEKLEDILMIENQLSSIRWQIDSIANQLRAWQSDVDYSTIRLSFIEVTKYTPVEEQSFFARLSNALASGFSDYADALGSFAVGAVYSLPFLLTCVVAGALAGLAMKKLYTVRKNRRGAEDDR